MAIVRVEDPKGYRRRLTLLKKLFWLYFLLLIFEGALRKWVAPGLSAPLLIVRDPVAIMIIWEAYRTHKWPQRWSALISMVTLLIAGLFIVQLITGNNPLIAEVYGLRSYLVPLPVMFIMGENLDEEDLRNLGACTLWLLLPMTLLVLVQYRAPSGSFLNKGAYEGAAQIGFAGAHVRPSGTFSFSIGMVQFGTLAGAFIFYAIFKDTFVKKRLLLASTFALILSIPAAGARAMVVQLGTVVGSVALAAAMGVAQFGKVLRIIVPVVLVALLASQLPIFSDAIQSLSERFSSADEAEGGGSVQETIYYRGVQPAVDAFERAASSNNWMGIGMGHGAAAMERLQNSDNFSAGEYEFSRELMEMGPIAGTAFLLFKVFLAIAIFGGALARARNQEPQALLMLPLATTMLFFGVFEQPTVQGFIVISVAFCIAAAKTPQVQVEPIAPILRQRLLYGSQVQRRTTRIR
jgi:hypothetical protein